jgi:hypothetical protein
VLPSVGGMQLTMVVGKNVDGSNYVREDVGLLEITRGSLSGFPSSSLAVALSVHTSTIVLSLP